MLFWSAYDPAVDLSGRKRQKGCGLSWEGRKSDVPRIRSSRTEWLEVR